MADRIEVDLSQLSGRLTEMRTSASKARSALTETNGALESLNSTWAGAAHDAFMAQYALDRETMQEALETLDKFLNSVNDAKDEYTKCEQSVGDIVNAIRV